MSVGRAVWTGAGFVAVGLGFVGMLVPGLPTTVFMIVALYCFKRGSTRFEQWLLNHKVFGPTLRDWERTKGIRPRTKKVAVTTLWLFMGVSLFFLRKKPIVGAIVAGCGVWVTWYILSRPDVSDSAVVDDVSGSFGGRSGSPFEMASIDVSQEKLGPSVFSEADAGGHNDL